MCTRYLVVSLGSRVPESGLASVVKESSAFIAESVDHGGRCLVHGLSGLSRSATLVLAYIIDAIKCTEQWVVFAYLLCNRVVIALRRHLEKLIAIIILELRLSLVILIRFIS